MVNKMIIRLGYVAISKALDITSSGTITYTNYLKEENKNEKLDKIIKLKHPYFIIQINAVNKGMDVFYVINRLI